jgi:hypothetical protein
VIPFVGSKIKDFGLCRQIDQMRSPIQDHIGKEFGLVHLTGLGAGDSDPDRNLIFYQIRQIVIRAVLGWGFHRQVSAGIGPVYPIINQKQIDLMPFGMGNFTELETARCASDIILT